MFTIIQGDMNEKIEALLREMTLEEKVALAAGASFGTTVPLERLGIPSIKVTCAGYTTNPFGFGRRWRGQACPVYFSHPNRLQGQAS
jgi:hypothetical protein